MAVIMKKLVVVLFVFLGVLTLNAQETYTVNGESLILKLKVEGTLDLLMSTDDNSYRYFIRSTNATITELLNTRDDEGLFREEYKATLETATSGRSAADVRFTYPSISTYVEMYDESQDENFEALRSKWKVQKRLSIFAGVTNSPFVTNPENSKTPLFGAEFELSEDRDYPRHSGFLQVRHVLEDETDFQYSTTEISLGYRFRFINKKAFNIYADVKTVTVNFSNFEVDDTLDNAPIFAKESSTAFDVPFIFAIGADFKIADNGYLTLGFNQLFAVFLENQGNFPTDVTLGYRMKL